MSIAAGVNRVNRVNGVLSASRDRTKRTLLTLLTLLTVSAASATAQTVPVMQSSFTGGEISPLAAARIDAPRYFQSAATMENLIAIPQGPAVRRPGTRFVAATDANQAARLVPFRYSTEDAYALEFTDSLLRVYRDHGLVTNADDSIYSLATDIDVNDIADLQTWQSADVLYLVDGADWPQKLVRTDHNDWSIADAEIEDGPFLSENATTASTIAASATTGDGITLTAAEAIFAAGHVGSYWRLRGLRGAQNASGLLSVVDTNSVELLCQADQTFQWYAHGDLIGTVELQTSSDEGVTWAPYTMLTGTAGVDTGDTTALTNDTGRDVRLRVRVTALTGGDVTYSLWVHAYLHTGVVQIVSYVDPCEVTADVVRELASTDATSRWSEGAWSGVRGFPRAVGSYSDRLVLASTSYQPLTIWFSATGEYESFDAAQGDDADSFAFTLGRSEQDPILWISSQRSRGLIAGTTGGILEMEPFDSTQGIKPANPPTVSNTLAVPCAAVSPILADNILLVLQRNGRKVREVLYSYDADALVAPDLTLFAEHVTAGGVTGWAWTNQPYTILWCVRADGALLSLTYDRNFQVVAWSRHSLGGAGWVESVCSVPGETDDELWLVVKRTVHGQTVRYVEYLSAWDFGDDQEDAFFVDCGLSYDGAAATAMSGLGHLEAKAVAVLADGAPVEGLTVASGALTLPDAANVVQIGLGYTSTLTTVRYDFAGESGVSWHRMKAVRKATVSFYETLGAKIGPDASDLFEPDWRASGGGMLVAGVPALFTGDREATLPAAFGTDAASVTIVQDDPLPMTIRAIVAVVEIR